MRGLLRHMTIGAVGIHPHPREDCYEYDYKWYSVALVSGIQVVFCHSARQVGNESPPAAGEVEFTSYTPGRKHRNKVSSDYSQILK